MKDSLRQKLTYQRVGSTEMLSVAHRHIPRPAQKDYDFGEIWRYFAQPANRPNGEIIEVSKRTYVKLKAKNLYRVVALRWKISGPEEDDVRGENLVIRGVRTANQAAIDQAVKLMPTIQYKLTNLLQLWRGW